MSADLAKVQFSVDGGPRPSRRRSVSILVLVMGLVWFVIDRIPREPVYRGKPLTFGWSAMRLLAIVTYFPIRVFRNPIIAKNMTREVWHSPGVKPHSHRHGRGHVVGRQVVKAWMERGQIHHKRTAARFRVFAANDPPDVIIWSQP